METSLFKGGLTRPPGDATSQYILGKDDLTDQLEEAYIAKKDSITEELEDQYIQREETKVAQQKEQLLDAYIQRSEPTTQLLEDAYIQRTSAEDAKLEAAYISNEPILVVTTSKSYMDVVADQILSMGTPLEQTERIIRELKTKHPKESSETLVRNIVTSLWTNMRPVIYTVVAATMLALAITLFHVYFTAGSWMLLLTILKNLGIKVLPGAVLAVLKKAGISVASTASINFVLGLAEKNKRVAKILSVQVKPQFVISSLKRIGVDITDTDLSIKNFTRTALSNGVALYSGDLSSFLVSTGFGVTSNIGTTVGTTTLKKAKEGIVKAVAKLGDVTQQTVNSVLSGEKTTDAIKITRKVEAEVLLEQPTEVSLKKRPKVRAKTTVNDETTSMIAENKAMVVGTTTAIAMISLAVATGNVESITEAFSERISSLGGTAIGELSLKGLNLVKESEAARRALFGILINQVGIQKLVNAFVDKLTPDSVSKMKKLIPTKKGQVPASTIDQLFFLLLGERIYTSKELQSLDIAYLRKIAKVKGIVVPSGTVNKKALEEAIQRDQTYRLNNLTQLVSSTLTNSVKVALPQLAMDFVYQNFPYALSPLEEINAQLLTESEVSEVQREKQLAEAQETLVKEKTALRSIRKVEREGVVAQRKETLLREADLRQKASHAKAEVKMAQRRLVDAAKLTDLAKKANIIIANEEGVAHPLPADEVLLDPRLQKTLQDIEFTPLLQYLSLQAAKSTVSWVPGLGYVDSVLNTINWSLDVAEKVKDVYKIVNVAVQLTDETAQSLDLNSAEMQTLDTLLKARLPTLSGAIADLVQLEKVNLKVLTLETLRDKILFGWDNSRVAYEIGKKVVVGKGVGDFSESTVKQIGEMIWGSLGGV